MMEKRPLLYTFSMSEIPSLMAAIGSGKHSGPHGAEVSAHASYGVY